MRHWLAGFLVLVLFLPGLPAAAEPAAADLLAQADLALLDGDTATACRTWHGLLSVPGPYRDIALFHLARWGASCPVPEHLDVLAHLAGQVLNPAAQTFRAAQLLDLMATRQGDRDLAPRHKPLRLTAAASGFLPLQAPTTWAFAVTTWPDGDAPGEGLGAGGVAWNRTCFEAGETVDVALRVRFPNPGRAQLDGQEFLLVGPDAGARFPMERTLGLRLLRGRHELRSLQGVGVAQADVTVDLLPNMAVVPVACQEGLPLAGFDLLTPAPDAVPDGLTPRLALAHGEVTDGLLKELAGAALDSPEGYLVYREALQVANLPASRRDDLQRELAASFLAGYDCCLPRLDLAEAALAAGEREAARKQLDGADESCKRTARGLLLQAEVARWMQWNVLQDQFLALARDGHPDDCHVQLRTLERFRELGLPLPAPSHPCPLVEPLLRATALQDGGAVAMPAPADFAATYRKASTAERSRLLPQLAQLLAEPAWLSVANGLIREEAQVAWALFDALLAAGQGSAALSFATRAARHRNTWEGLRTQAGRLLFWQDVTKRQMPIAAIIDQYIEAGFAAGSPQVVVLDEAVARPDTNGWLTLAETTVLHVASPDAAEDIGEIALGADEELLELAVRKADGRWFGPTAPAAGTFKETLSLAGLAPGDFILRRTIREVPLQGGTVGCASLPTFTFTPREVPVFLSRYVLVDPLKQYHLVTGGGLDVVTDEQGAVVELYALEPVPAEPRCPEPDAGTIWLQPVARCSSWDRLRDQVGDALLGYCNTSVDYGPAPTPNELYQWVLNHVEEDGSSLFDAGLRDIVEAGSGNRVLALYCALVQAGYDAHIVAAHSPAAPAINWPRPALTPFDGMLVYLGGGDGRWFDPYDPLIPAGYLRPALRGCTGLLLTPRYPKLFIKTDDRTHLEGWTLTIDGSLDGHGALTGRLVVDAGLDAAVSLHRQVREGGQEARQRLAESILHMMLPGMEVGSYDVALSRGNVHMDIEFSGNVDVLEVGRLVLRLPPIPSQDLVQLAQRSSPLYYGGILPLEVAVTLRFDRALTWSAPEGREVVEDPFITLAMAIEQSPRELRIHKTAQARPQRISPEDYDAFVRSVIGTHRLKLLPVEVRRAASR
jgi:hypothetical protein